MGNYGFESDKWSPHKNICEEKWVQEWYFDTFLIIDLEIIICSDSSELSILLLWEIVNSLTAFVTELTVYALRLGAGGKLARRVKAGVLWFGGKLKSNSFRAKDLTAERIHVAWAIVASVELHVFRTASTGTWTQKTVEKLKFPLNLLTILALGASEVLRALTHVVGKAGAPIETRRDAYGYIKNK